MSRPTSLLAVAGLLMLSLSTSSGLAAQGSGMSPAERQQIASHKLTMDNISKAAVAAGKLRELEKDPKFKAILVNKEEAKSLEDVIAKMDATPQIRSAVESSGLTSREFMLTVIGLASTQSAAKLMAMGGAPAKAAAGLPTSPQNLQFYAAHQAEIEKLAGAMLSSEDDADN
jgi:N-methylhydantoinase A/oxoprolinase/acetone carboxylase beta subunit